MFNWNCALSMDSRLECLDEQPLHQTCITCSGHHHLWHTIRCMAEDACLQGIQHLQCGHTEWGSLAPFLLPKVSPTQAKWACETKVVNGKRVLGFSVKSHWSFTVVFEVLFCWFLGTVQLPLCLKFCSVHFFSTVHSN